MMQLAGKPSSRLRKRPQGKPRADASRDPPHPGCHPHRFHRPVIFPPPAVVAHCLPYAFARRASACSRSHEEARRDRRAHAGRCHESEWHRRAGARTAAPGWRYRGRWTHSGSAAELDAHVQHGVGRITQFIRYLERETVSGTAPHVQDMPPAEGLLAGGTQAPVNTDDPDAPLLLGAPQASVRSSLRDRTEEGAPSCASASTACSPTSSSRNDTLHAARSSRGLMIMAEPRHRRRRLPQDRPSRLEAGRQARRRRRRLDAAHGLGQSVSILRLLDKDSGAARPRRRSGWALTTLAVIDSLIREPYGIVLVTGPTGSGKTTTFTPRCHG